jgi:hypothetical protein
MAEFSLSLVVARYSTLACACVLLVGMAGTAAHAQLAVVGRFDTIAGATGVAHDPVGGSVWISVDGEASVRQFSASGQSRPPVSLAAPLGVHADIDVAPQDLTLSGAAVPAGSLLVIDGNSGGAVIQAVDPVTGAVLATLQTSFGAGHVVGGAYHPERGSFFLAQDREPGNPGNLLAEISPADGALLAIFVITNVRPGFSVERGDLDIAPNGNLLVASSDETVIGEFSPLGDFIAEHSLPAGVGALSGIATDPARGEIWAVSTSGEVWRLGAGPACTADFNADDAVNSQDFFDFLNAFFAGAPAADFNADSIVNSQDFFDFLNAFFEGC